jgi:hypothetical protein
MSDYRKQLLDFWTQRIRAGRGWQRCPNWVFDELAKPRSNTAGLMIASYATGATDTAAASLSGVSQ